jgi:hypothetical protein
MARNLIPALQQQVETGTALLNQKEGQIKGI